MVVVPNATLTMQHPAFLVIAPFIWISLSLQIRLPTKSNTHLFYKLLKTHLGPSIKYVTLFLAIFDPLPSPCLTLSHVSGPPKVRHTSRTPQFLVVQTKPYKKPIQNLSQLFAGDFVWKVVSSVVLVRAPSPSVRIHP